MNRYLRIYKKLLEMNFATFLIYRANFVNNLLSSLTWGLLIFIQMLLLTSRAPVSFGWSRDEILFITGVFGILVSLFHMLLTPNFELLARNIYLGKLDYFFLKPFDNQFLVSVWHVNYVTLIRLIISLVFTGIYFVKLHISFSFINSIFFICLLSMGFSILYCIWIMAMSLLFWFPRLNNLIKLMFNITGLSRYPGEMFSSFSKILFYTIFPIIFIVFVPTKIFLGKFQPKDLFGLVMITLVMLVGSRKFWKFALKHYTSAGG